MELNQYQALACRTAKWRDGLLADLDHACLGIGSESGELALTIGAAWMRMPFNVDNICEEIGDACWYAALMSQVMGWKFEDLILEPGTASEMSNELAAAVLGRNPVALALMLCAFSGDILTICKAAIMYGKPLDDVMLKRKLSLFVTTASLLSDIHGFSFEKVTLKHNIAKLQKRYPDKYSDEAAIARADKPAGE